MAEQILAILAALGLFAIHLLFVGIALARKRDAASAFAWSFAILFLPLLGLLLFLVFGRERLPRRLKRKVLHGETFGRRLHERGRQSRRRGDESNQGWPEMSRMLTASGAPPIRSGNEVTLLFRGQKAFESIRTALATATHHIHVEEYIFRRDALGTELLELMIEKARAGVEVRLLVDAIGTPGSWKLIRALQKAGGDGAVFLPFRPFGKLFTLNLRNHRKIIICDGRVGFLGGMNVGDEYFGRGPRSRGWRDAHIRIEGPAVADLQVVFVEDWDFAAGELLTDEDYFPSMPFQGGSRVQIVHSGPDEERNSAELIFFTALARANRHIRLSSPYLVPDPALRAALCSAALRGVVVDILTQGRPPEMWSTYLCSRFYWESLLTAGVQIFEYQGGILHAKALTIDDQWALIGSPNLDNRSLQLNFEVLSLLENAQDVRRLSDQLDREFENARQVKLDTFRQRPRRWRAAESAARLLAPVL